uniref:Uncharacterized protein n=1 Tax=Oryza barthii TaxID=65489 RepID=A0A0D3HCD1_9ORYZ
MAKDVGFKGGDELFYAIPGYSLENGIDKLHDDHSVRKMLNFAKKGKSMEIYIKHLEQGVSATPIFGQDVEDNHVEETWLALQPIEILEFGELRDTRNMKLEEMVAMFLHILGHDEKNRAIHFDFQRSPETTKKAKESKLTTKKRDKRTWTAEEEKLLIDILYDMNDSSWKVDTGHKSGYLTFIEKEMAKVLPRADLKADPHIKSKVKILKKQLSYILEIQQNGSGFGWDDENKMVTGDRDIYMGWAKSREGAGPLYMKPMLHFDKLCEIYASDLAKGGSAKGPGEQQGVEDFSVLDGDDPVSHHVDKVSLQPQGNENPIAPKGRKRVFADVDTLEASLCNVANSFAKFLEAEKENGMQMAMMNTVQVQEDTKKTKLLDAIKKLPNFSIEEVVMAVRIIGRDSGNIDLFLTMSPDYQVAFVRQELADAAKKKLDAWGLIDDLLIFLFRIDSIYCDLLIIRTCTFLF